MVIKKLIQWFKKLLGFRDNLPSDVLAELNFEDRPPTKWHYTDDVTSKQFVVANPRYWCCKTKRLCDSFEETKDTALVSKYITISDGVGGWKWVRW